MAEILRIDEMRAQGDDKYRLLFDLTNDGLIILDLQGHIVDINRTCLENIGYTKEEMLGKHISQFDPPEFAKTVPKRFAEIRTHRSAVFETAHLHKNGTRIPVEISARLIKLDGEDYVFSIVRNIADRKKIQRDLELTRAAVDKAKLSVFLVNREGRVTDANEHACSSLGYSRSELIGKFVWDFDPDYSPEGRRATWDIVKKEGSRSLESRHRRKDGTIYPVEVSINHVSFGDEEFTLSFAQEITEKKERERQNRFLTQIYAALLHANQALWESKSEQELFDRICHVAVQFGGLAMAWVGRKEEGGDLIRPESYYGDSKEYLDGIVISSRADVPEGRGPTGTAFREGRPVLIQDFFSDSVTQPWRDKARPFNWQAVAAFGILRGGKPHGVISFYHHEKNAFSREIAELLQEMAKDIGHALDRFDLEAEKHEALQSLEESANRYQNIIQTTADGFFVVDLEGRILEVNDAYVRRSGFTREELLRMRIKDVEAMLDEAELARTIQELMETGRLRLETKNRAKDGSVWPLEVSAVYSSREGGRIFAFVHDVTNRRQLEDEMRIAASVFESQEPMMVADANRIIIRVNEAFVKCTGYALDEVGGQNPRILQSGFHTGNYHRELWDRVDRSGSWQGEVWDKRKNGEVYPKWLTVSSVKNKEGQVTHYVGSFSDLSEYKEAQDKIQSLAFYDQLTGLPNRRLMLDRLERALAASARSRRYGAILYLDLDHFKVINDTQGHDSGDAVLQETARRIQSTVRQKDSIARLGGDEFVVLLEEISEDHAQAAAQAKLVGDKLLEVLVLPYQVKGKHYPGSVSIGVALFWDSRESVHEILKRGDLAMYEAKKAGRNALRFFDPAMQENLERRTQLEADLRRAFAERQFQLYYQKRIGRGGKVTGAEVLLRWNHPQRGMIAPLDFIPVAEETGLIVPIGKWVLDETCRQIKAWEGRSETKGLKLSMNVSARELKQSDFVDNVKKAVERTRINPSALSLEITESILLDNIEEFIVKMKELKEIGISFALDDFGTGYSSLSHLKRLPINELKIDKSFVRDLGVDKNDEAIVRTIIQMGETLGMDVVAEGVETPTHRAMLERYGCHNYQGYLFGKPTALENFERELE